MDCQVTFTANAGVIVKCGQFRFAVDALHEEKTPYFSTMSGAMCHRVLDEMEEEPWDLMINTHHHLDHASRRLTAEVLRRKPKTLLLDPCGQEDFQSHLERVNKLLAEREIHIEACYLEHAQPIITPGLDNYGFLLTISGHTLLFTGDSAFEAPEIKTLIAGRQIDVAFLNFTWITGKVGRRILPEVVRPKHMVVFHIPFDYDDEYDYRTAVQACRKSFFADQDVRIMLDCGQKETIRLLPV